MRSMSRQKAMDVLGTGEMPEFGDLVPLDPKAIEANPLNPRRLFPAEEQDRLLESIKKEGILVPLIVYEQEGRFFLLDGERRLRSARKLGLAKVPAHVLRRPPDELHNLLTMFHIHHHVESWDPMPTAWSLAEVMKRMQTQDITQLADATGLSRPRIRRSLMLLRAPEDIQQRVFKGDLDPSYVYEIDPVLTAYEERYPALVEKHGGRGRVLRTLVEKYDSGVVKTPTAYRDLLKVARGTDLGGSEDQIREICDRVLSNPDFPPSEAYTIAIEAVDMANTIEGRASRLQDLLADFDPPADTLQARPKLQEVLAKLRDVITVKLKEWRRRAPIPK